MARILVSDDNADSRSGLRQILESMGHVVTDVKDSRKAVSSACSFSYDLVILDIGQKPSGCKAVKTIKEECPDLALLVSVADGLITNAVEAMKLGACDYLVKPWTEETGMRIERALEECRRINQLKCVLDDINHHYSLHNAVSINPEFNQAVDLANKAASTNSPVLITGELGTGKECLAREIHCRSSRAGRLFAKIGCRGITGSALDAMLLGVEDGGFSGGIDHGIGQIDLAYGGTLFLDEVTCISLSTQAMLLEMIESGRFSRIGGTNAIPSNIRIIASTSQDTAAALEEGKLDRNFLKAMGNATITLPPLRERREDIPVLADCFIRKYAAEIGKQVPLISNAAIEIMLMCEWPGNIREFRNCIERSVILCDGDLIQPVHLSLNGKPAAKRKIQSVMKSLRDIERDHIKKVLVSCNWNRSSAANILEIDRKTLRSKIREFGFTPPSELPEVK